MKTIHSMKIIRTKVELEHADICEAFRAFLESKGVKGRIAEIEDIEHQDGGYVATLTMEDPEDTNGR